MGAYVQCISLTVTWKVCNVQGKNDRITREEYHGQFFFFVFSQRKYRGYSDYKVVLPFLNDKDFKSYLNYIWRDTS